MSKRKPSCGSCGQRRCTRSAACVGTTTVREAGSTVPTTYVHSNVNGLTFERWYAAATFGVAQGRKPAPSSMLAAWRAGEDPTDHARALA